MAEVLKVKICDFCTTLDPEWKYLCTEFSVAIVTDKGVITAQDNHPEWWLCDICHEYVAFQQWNRIIDRAMDAVSGIPSPNLQSRREIVTSQVMGFRRHRIAEVLPIHVPRES